ncbi:MAG TPA: sensor histidine kinase [Nitriliruptorales bacterium]|nr:sensor histidine kinase [Nitriliruptorales bacterium]
MSRLTAEVALAATVAAVAVGGSVAVQRFDPGRPLDGLAYAVLVAGAAVLVARRHRPVVVSVVTGAAALAYYLSGYTGLIFPAVALLVALYTVVAGGQRRPALAVAAAVLAGFAVDKLVFPGTSPPDVEGLLWVTGFITSAVVLGEVSRSRRDYLTAVEERAREAERTRQEEALRRAGEERLRIARELHDAIGHSISLISVQAGVALHLMDAQPEHARAALLTIKHTSREALGELRHTLGALRQVDDDRAPRSPGPSLTRLEELVARLSVGDLHVQIMTAGDPRPLPAAVDAAAYRIVQESLTNVARHAAASTATVAIGFEARELTVQVDDDGRGVSDGSVSGGGTGIAGMRERAAATGGQLHAGPRPGGGFRVQARLPLEGAR